MSGVPAVVDSVTHVSNIIKVYTYKYNEMYVYIIKIYIRNKSILHFIHIKFLKFCLTFGLEIMHRFICNTDTDLGKLKNNIFNLFADFSFAGILILNI